MATVGKNIHKQRICTIKRKSSGRRQPYLTLLPFFATEKLSVSARKKDWQLGPQKKQRYGDDELVVLSFLLCLS